MYNNKIKYRYEHFLRQCLVILSLIVIVGSTISQAHANQKPLDLADYKGKVVYVSFWSANCKPCLQSFWWLNSLRSQMDAGLTVLSVNIDENEALANRILARYGVNFKTTFDPKREHARYYRIPSVSTSIIFDRKGRPVHQHSGFNQRLIPQYQAAIDSALNLPHQFSEHD